MATFARFTMQLTYAIGHQFSNVRTFAFVDGIDEVTKFFGPGADFAEALLTMASEAASSGETATRDYGTRSARFVTSTPMPSPRSQRSSSPGTPATTTVIRGIEVLAGIAERAPGALLAQPGGEPLLEHGRLDHGYLPPAVRRHL